MNERIRELAKQAGLDIDDSLAVEPEPTYYGTQSDFEKFSQSIIAECLYLCESTAVGQDAEAIQEAIKQHFGVKE